MSDSTNPFKNIDISDRGQRALDRLKEIFQVEELPEGFQTLGGSENGVNDLYMNLNRQLGDGKFERAQKLLVAVAVASVAGSSQAVEFFAKAAIGAGRTQKDVLEAVGVAGTCSIFNGHYRFRDQVSEEDKATFEAFRAPFNANVFVKAALPMTEVEAICIAVSSINGCHKCVQGHIAKGKEVGLTDEQIDEIIRGASAAAAAANIASALAVAGAAESVVSA